MSLQYEESLEGIRFLLDITVCRAVDRLTRFERAYCFHLQCSTVQSDSLLDRFTMSIHLHFALLATRLSKLVDQRVIFLS